MDYLEKWDEFTRQPILKESKPSKDNKVYVMSGRTALHYIIRDIMSRRIIKDIYMPEYSSNSMIYPLVEWKINIHFYKVWFSSHLQIAFDETNRYDCILLMNYFGFTDKKIIEIANHQRAKGKIVIIDNTQTLFCDYNYSSYADYTFASYRKWYASNAAEIIMPKADHIVLSKTNYRYESLRNELFDAISKGNNNKIKTLTDSISAILENDYENYAPSPSEIYYNQNIDRRAIFETRRKNAQLLIEGLKAICSKRFALMFKKVKKEDCPLCIPLILSVFENRESFLRFLITNNILCTYHWNVGPFHLQSCNQNILFTHEVSLSCDQRLSVSDIDYMVEMISLWNDEKV